MLYTSCLAWQLIFFVGERRWNNAPSHIVDVFCCSSRAIPIVNMAAIVEAVADEPSNGGSNQFMICTIGVDYRPK